MKNKTTYEMEDIIGLITQDLAKKGLEPDNGAVSIRAETAEGSVAVLEVEIDVNVSWVGLAAPSNLIHAHGHSTASSLVVPAHEDHVTVLPRDLLDEAPKPGARPAVEIGSVTAASRELAGSTAGPFSPEKVRQRATYLEGETDEYPGPSRIGGR